MASEELQKDIQDKVDQFSDEARKSFQAKDYEQFEKWQLKKWETIPEPKERWEESFRLSKLLITFYIKYYVDFDKAKIWFDRLVWLDDIQQQHPGEVSLMQGKIFFEQENFTEAYQSFKKAFEESEGHCFGSGDEKYLEFYNNPTKFSESKPKS